jgi:3D (Asp-Asp-Asp) domain-containing protein
MPNLTKINAGILFSALVSCSTPPPKAKPFGQYLTARITYYSPDQDRWGWRNADPTVKKSTVGVTVAAHPCHEFGTKVYIPKLAGVVGDGHFIVQDRGSAVTHKHASGGKCEVIDVFVQNKSTIRRLSHKNPEHMTVYILQ